MSSITPVSVLRCPACGHADTLVMPTDACLFFHACAGCGVMLRPSPGDCCVFCSYGSVACPPMQAGGSCSAGRQETCCGAAPAVAVAGAATPMRGAV